MDANIELKSVEAKGRAGSYGLRLSYVCMRLCSRRLRQDWRMRTARTELEPRWLVA